jgi:hypothetical protein
MCAVNKLLFLDSGLFANLLQRVARVLNCFDFLSRVRMCGCRVVFTEPISIFNLERKKIGRLIARQSSVSDELCFLLGCVDGQETAQNNERIAKNFKASS